MQASGQTTLGFVARAALVARGHISDLDGLHLKEERPIPDADRRDLARYFSEESRSQHNGAGSNFNAMLDRMALYAKVCRPCVKCGGLRERRDKDTGELLTEERSGTGIATDGTSFRDWEELEMLCGRPTGAGAVQAWLNAHNGGDYWCTTCKGRGWVVKWRKDPKRPPTVRITGQQPTGVHATTTGGSELLSLLGRVGRKRAAMRTLDALAEATLTAWFSPDGGTIPSLWHLTPMGQTMLAENQLGRPHQAFFRSLQIAQGRNQDPRRERQFELASKQAHALLHRMRRVWHEVSG